MSSTLTSTYSNGQSTTLNSLVCIGIDVSGAEAHLDEEGRKRLEAAEAPLVRTASKGRETGSFRARFSAALTNAQATHRGRGRPPVRSRQLCGSACKNIVSFR